jgi:flavodoxin/formate hydrogenlyase subunit 6/NADH:ubiquinone oxidoreductase subunit I
VQRRHKEDKTMSKSLIVYFSQGGTTARTAQSIAAGLRTAGYQVDLCHLVDGQPPALDGYDLLGIGMPVHYFRPPFALTDYVEGLPHLGGLPAFTFVLHGTLRGDAGTAMRRLLARKGAREVGYFACRGDDYFLGYLKLGYLFSPDHPTAEELAQAEAFGQAVAAHAAGQEYAPPAEDAPPGAIYQLERFALSRWLAEQVYSRLFRVNKDRCTACDLCVRGCPTGNITKNQEGHPVWGRNCLLCLYCEMHCPQDAITSPVSWPLFVPFLKYNVSRASRNPSLDYVRVKHGQGRTQRL